ncbi:GAF domain-containing protein [Lentilactobacillus kribbianus]|uniref:GAF domain-containing protein n=1 Tax=Lentilactobacillus kribbianus TaxID=2729622 RepID=UPI0015564381|nr:GAF domain-containing protein [Lentilactobacillus kribbianus]
MKKLNNLLSKQLSALLTGENDVIANMANTSALIKDALTDTNWVGFYRYQKDKDELILGPFQGKVACMHIKNGDGVCGTALKQNKSQLVANVHQFPGHIACDAASNSELVVPLYLNGQPFGVIDIDSPLLDRFSVTDLALVEELAEVFLDSIDNVAKY